MNPRERKYKRRKKMNLTIFWLKRSKNKSLLKNNKWETERENNSIDSNKSWNKTSKMREDSENKLKENDLRYFFIDNSGYQNARRIRKTSRRTWEEKITIKTIKIIKNQTSNGFICWFSHQGSKVTNQIVRWKNAQTYRKST